jgi:DNA-binding response OmpR family regulator
MEVKVLIIEDDREIIESISLALSIYWPKTILVSTHLGYKGVEMVKAEKPDIVILDLGLPDTDGFEVLRQIRLFSSIPVVVLTVKSDEKDVVRMLEGGANDYMIKPFRQLELLARLKTQLIQSMTNNIKAFLNENVSKDNLTQNQ